MLTLNTTASTAGSPDFLLLLSTSLDKAFLFSNSNYVIPQLEKEVGMDQIIGIDNHN